MASQLILPTAYLPPVQWFTRLLRGRQCIVEACESYAKQTYRNRCVIDSPQGALALTVPVESSASRLVRDIRVSEHGAWRHRHWQALVSSYAGSPFFEYYADDFRPLYERRYDYLLDLNEALTAVCLDLLNLEVALPRTEQYASLAPEEDLRRLISPKVPLANDSSFAPVPYYQVFGAKRKAFLPNLSIVDLLFNMGPESIIILHQSTLNTL